MSIRPYPSRMPSRRTRGVRRTAPPQVGLLVSLLCLAALPARGQEGCLTTLYRRFLTNIPSSGFVAFERNLVYPEPPHSGSPVVEGGGNRPIPLKNNCWCFLWDGPRFLIVSSPAAITHETDLASRSTAPRLFYGYDGQTYWILRANAVRSYRAVNGGPDLLHPAGIASALAVFDKEEASALGAAGSQSDRRLAGILERAAESRRVVQMGFSLPLAEPPRLVAPGQLLLTSLDGRSQTARFTGPRERPETFEYLGSSRAIGNFRVTLGFQTNTLAIDRLSSRGKRRVSSIHYKLLAASVPAPALADSVFAWQTYQPAEGRLIRETPEE